MLTIVGVLSAVALTGCGGSSSSSTASSGEPSGPPSGFQLSSAQEKKIRHCLEAAGLSTSFPTGQPTDFPSGGPSGSPPSGSPPSGFPSGGFSGGPGGPGGGLADPDVQSALKACGISLPSRPTGSASTG
jgi:hypothetical protein